MVTGASSTPDANSARTRPSARVTPSARIATIPGIAASSGRSAVGFMRLSRRRALRLGDGRRDLFGPARLLALEDATRNLDEGAGAMEEKLVAPRRWDVGEVLVNEHIHGTPRLVRRQGVKTDPGGDVRGQVRGVPHGVAEHDRVEIDEAHPVARYEDVVGLQVPMDRGRRNVRETSPDRCREGLDLRS